MPTFLPSTDQIIVFLAVTEHGNFSAAAKALRRTQSSVTYAIQKLEADLGLTIFDRSARVPALTTEGRALVPMARRLALEIRTMQQSAESMAQGVERKLLLAIDCVYPEQPLFDVLKCFHATFPTVRARIQISSMHQVAQAVIDGTAMLGIVGPVVEQYGELISHPIGSIVRIPVAAPGHALGQVGQAIPMEAFRRHVQIVMANASKQRRARMLNGPEGVLWRVDDIGFKQRAILAGLAWGRLPAHLAEPDLAAGRLVRLHAADLAEDDWCRPLAMHVAWRRNDGLGPAAGWMRAALEDMAKERARSAGSPA